jgi:acyl-CoA synthetase (AMP-forming)/AMP-acid ligase II
MFPRDIPVLRDFIGREAAGRTISDPRTTVPLADLTAGSCLGGHLAQLSGRSVLISVSDQLRTGIAMIELDGIARRMLLCPPDLNLEHIPSLIDDAEIDAIVCDDPVPWKSAGVSLTVTASLPLKAAMPARTERTTEWLMLTSGTAGLPKIVHHSLATLIGAIVADAPSGNPAATWATFYDIRRYGGLQIFLRAIVGGGSIVLSAPGESIAEYVARLIARGVTHISGTPSHWRKALMSGEAASFAPRYVRLSGEIADQAVLDSLRRAFPASSIGHAYASTEAGVGFAVNDGLEGFPASMLRETMAGVEMKVEEGSLRIRSPRTAYAYVGRKATALMDADGFIDTGDMVDLRDGRYYFVGRRGGIVNVGGLKVHPEEVEAVINRHRHVRMSRVRSRKSPITGAIVIADVVLSETAGALRSSAIRDEIMAMCRESLAIHKVPAVITIVSSLDVTPSGKLTRQNA